mmetsp:Transcript_28175/g.73857  ORF Transcript_28175/g.73857 Transcript_28175/m.73857 type:complete len:251 (+) Transcript_28175:408-1160(+)
MGQPQCRPSRLPLHLTALKALVPQRQMILLRPNCWAATVWMGWRRTARVTLPSPRRGCRSSRPRMTGCVLTKSFKVLSSTLLRRCTCPPSTLWMTLSSTCPLENSRSFLKQLTLRLPQLSRLPGVGKRTASMRSCLGNGGGSEEVGASPPEREHRPRVVPRWRSSEQQRPSIRHYVATDTIFNFFHATSAGVGLVCRGDTEASAGLCWLVRVVIDNRGLHSRCLETQLEWPGYGDPFFPQNEEERAMGMR